MATAKVVIKGDNQLKQPLNQAKQDLSLFGQSAEKLGETLKKAFAVTAIIGAVGKLGDALKDCFNDFSEAEKKYKQMALAVGDASAFDKMTTTISKLSKQTLESKGSIESMVSQLASMGKSADEVDKISSAAVYLSNVTGKDLSTSMQMLIQSTNGTTTALKKCGIDLGNLTKEELANGAAIDIVIDKFGEMSSTIASQSTQQSFKNMSETFGDLKQAIGAMVDFNIHDFVGRLETGFNGVAQKITEVVAVIGAVIKNFPDVFSVTLKTLFEMVRKTFEWDSIKTIFITLFENIVTVAKAALKAISEVIPNMVKDIFLGVGAYIASLGATLYDTLHNSIGDAIADAIDWVADRTPGWLKNLLHMDGGFRDSLRSTSDTAGRLQKIASDSFQDLGKQISSYVSLVGSTASTVSSNTAGALDTIYGDIFDGFLEKVDDIISVDVAKLSAKIATNGGSDILSATEGQTQPTANSQAIDLGKVLRDFASGTMESVKQIKSLTDMVSMFKQIANPLVVIAEGFLETLEPVVTELLNPLFQALKGVGSMLADFIIPVVRFFGQVITSIAATINWAVDWIKYAIGKATFWDKSDDKAKPSSWQGYYDSLSSGLTGGTSSSNAVASSSYVGGQSVTINIYQSGAVVGDGGMREFAQMIRSEFDNLNYYSIA